jgi:cytoskeletal protein CcmA (bactofilin family)
MRLNYRRLLLVVALFAAVATLSLPAALAATQQTGPERKFRSGTTVTVAANETLQHDLYAVGSTVNIDGRIEGDLVAMGSTVTVRGAVTGDIAATGGTVVLSGPVDGDIRAAGGNVEIGGQVREDVLVGAGALTLTSSAQVGQDLIFGTGSTNLAGNVAGNVLGSTGGYTRTGTVRGLERVEISEGEEAERLAPLLASRILDVVRRYLSVVLFGVLLLWLAPQVIRGAATLIRERPLPSVGWGLGALVIAVGLLIVLFIALLVIVIPLGILGFDGLVATSIFGTLLGGSLLTFLLLVVFFFIADAIVGFAIGRLILGSTGQPSLDKPIIALLLGVLIVVILTAIPVVGGLLHALSFLFGLGGLVLVLWRGLRGRPETAAVPAA